MSEFEAARSSRTMLLAAVVIVVIAVSAVGVAYLTGVFGPTQTTTTTTERVLTVLTRHDLSIMNVFEPAFLASSFATENGITDVKWKAPDGQFWDDLINQSTVDVCWGGGPTLFDQLMRDDYLAPLTSERMQAVAARVNDTIAGASMKRNNTDGDLVWVAAAISSFGFTINQVFLDDHVLPVPLTWTDLANATYGTLLPGIPTIAMGNAPQTTSNTRCYEIMTQALGWEQGWITMARMAGSSGIYAGSVETQTAVEQGEVGVAMSIDFYGYLSQSQNPDCMYIVPEGQTIINGDPIAIASTSSNKDLAELFVDFVLSPEGQALWLNPNISRMPVMREAFLVPGAPQALYSAFNQTIATVGIEFNDTLSLMTNAALVPYWASVFTMAHPELVACWAKIVDAWELDLINGTELDYYAGLMGQVVSVVDPKTSLLSPFTLEYAMQINDDMIYDASYSSQMASLWTAAAKIQYINVMNMVDALFP